MVARLLGNRFCQAGLVLLVVAVLFLVTGALHPFALAQGRKPVPLGDIPVTAAVRACASPGGQRGGGVAVISAGASSASTSTGSTSTGSTSPGGSCPSSRGRGASSADPAAPGAGGPGRKIASRAFWRDDVGHDARRDA